MKSFALALMLVALPALAGEEPKAMFGVAPSLYLDVVSVGCAPPSNGNIVYVWHDKISGIDDAKVMRIFKHMQSPQFEGCLSAIAKTKPGLYEDLLALRADTYPDTAIATQRRAKAAWIEYGADLALAEVATTGTPGPDTKRFFERCDQLSQERN